MEEEQFRTSVQELFQSIRFVLSLDSRNSETLIFTQVRKPATKTKTFFFLVQEAETSEKSFIVVILMLKLLCRQSLQ